MIRLQVWLLVVMLVAQFTSLSVAVDAGVITSSTSKSVSSATAAGTFVRERFLRGGEDTTSGIVKPENLANPDEEKALVLPKGLQIVVHSAISAADKTLYKAVKLFGTNAGAEKTRNFIYDRAMYPFHYSQGRRPKHFEELANKQTNPYQKEWIQFLGNDFTEWVAKHHPSAI